MFIENPERWIDDSNTVPVAPPIAPLHAVRTKRALDVAGAAFLLLLFLPLMLIIAGLVRLDGGPVLFGHRRIGAGRRPFRCWKFRSMVVDAEGALRRLLETDPQARADWAESFKLKRDPRITWIGGVLRTTSLDELPQLINVLRGEMSLVGPRPIVEAEIDRYGPAFLHYAACRPGITGLWQVSGRNDVDYAHRVRLDSHYVCTWSVGRDLVILLRTVGVMVRRSGAY